MSSRTLTRGVVIALEVDPTLVHLPKWSRSSATVVDRVATLLARRLRLRLLPCRGGVRLLRPGKELGELHVTPDALAAELGSHALDWAILAGECCPETATWHYREDRWRFYLAAARAVREDPRCLGLWGEV